MSCKLKHKDSLSNTKEVMVNNGAFDNWYNIRDLPLFRTWNTRLSGMARDKYGVGRLYVENETGTKAIPNTQVFREIDNQRKQLGLYENGERKVVPSKVYGRTNDTTLLTRLFEGNKTSKAHDVLDRMVSSGAFLSPLASKLRGYIGDLDIDVITKDSPEYQGLRKRTPIDFSWVYDSHVRKVYILEDGTFPSGKADSVILHEILHNLTYDSIRGKNLEMVQGLYERVLTEFERNDYDTSIFPLKNLDEFVVGVFTNAELIRLLQTLPGTNSSTLWKEVLDMFKAFFNLSTEDVTMLDEVMSELSVVLEDRSFELSNFEGLVEQFSQADFTEGKITNVNFPISKEVHEHYRGDDTNWPGTIPRDTVVLFRETVDTFGKSIGTIGKSKEDGEIFESFTGYLSEAMGNPGDIGGGGSGGPRTSDEKISGLLKMGTALGPNELLHLAYKSITRFGIPDGSFNSRVFDALRRDFGIKIKVSGKGSHLFAANETGLFLNYPKFAQFSKSFENTEDLYKTIELAWSEELIHSVISNVSTEKERAKIFREMKKSDIDMVKSTYRILEKGVDNDGIVQEYLRMLIQNKYFNTTSELENKPNVKAIFQRVYDWLKKVVDRKDLLTTDVLVRFDNFLQTGEYTTDYMREQMAKDMVKMDKILKGFKTPPRFDHLITSPGLPDLYLTDEEYNCK